MEENLFSFTEEERKEAIQLMVALRQEIGDSLRSDDEQKIKQHMQQAFDNHRLQRDVFGLNPVLHALQTADLAAREMGLKRDGVLAILLCNSVVEGYKTIEDIHKGYGDGVANIIHGICRIHDLYKKNPVIESENFRNLLLSFAEDMRVILIIIADSVNLMRHIRDT